MWRVTLCWLERKWMRSIIIWIVYGVWIALNGSGKRSGRISGLLFWLMMWLPLKDVARKIRASLSRKEIPMVLHLRNTYLMIRLITFNSDNFHASLLPAS